VDERRFGRSKRPALLPPGEQALGHAENAAKFPHGRLGHAQAARAHLHGHDARQHGQPVEEFGQDPGQGGKARRRLDLRRHGPFQRGGHLAEQPQQDGFVQFFLGADVIVESGLVHTGPAGDGVHLGPGIADPAEFLGGGVQNAFPRVFLFGHAITFWFNQTVKLNGLSGQGPGQAKLTFHFHERSVTGMAGRPATATTRPGQDT